MTNPHAEAFLTAFAGIDTIYDFRAMHDRQRDVPAIPLRGTFAQCEAELNRLNNQGYGIHVMINETDGSGRLVSNVVACRAQLLDLDGIDAGQQLERVNASPTPPHMIVHTSPGKVQLWFKVIHHADKQLYVDNQRRLIGAYNGDVQFIDAAHTARLPGFYHSKAAPSLVTLAAGPMWNAVAYDAWAIAAPLLHVPLVGGSADARQSLGHGPFAAHSLEWLTYALSRIDPNSLGRDEWIAVTAATKQAGWNFGPDSVRAIWDAWCARYGSNNLGENNKQWNDITATSAGWNALVKRAGIGGDLLAASMAATQVRTADVGQIAQTNIPPVGSGQASGYDGAPSPASTVGPFLTPYEQAGYFRGCTFITEVGRILGPNNRLMDANRFNGTYGGKMFMLDNDGNRTTDEPWKAALRGQAFTIPKADHLRFLPSLSFGALVHDEFGETGVNRYRNPRPIAVAGDVTPFLKHAENLFPNPSDRAVLFAHMAQCVQRPGVKIKWAVLIQSAEGAGKTLFQLIMEAAVGQSYVHVPNARELTEGGGKFNGWMMNKLMIIINEVKTDEKRELIEVMKPWITDYRIDMQAKGQDQITYDNPTNLMMFTNYKDAIPVNDNSRRYAILYSAIQSAADLVAKGMTGDYFSSLYKWAENGGAAHVVDWLMHYQIPAELDGQRSATRAPRTSSTDEAVAISRGWLEQMIVDAVEGGRQGFRNGWVGSAALNCMIKEAGMKLPGPTVAPKALAALGYNFIGRATKIYIQEHEPYQSRLYNLSNHGDIKSYGRDQGYEP